VQQNLAQLVMPTSCQPPPYMLCSSTINYRYGTKSNNLLCHTSSLTLHITSESSPVTKWPVRFFRSSPVTMWPVRFFRFFGPWALIPLVRVRREIRPSSLYPWAVSPSGPDPPEPTTYPDIEPNSTKRLVW
jgi:hypothetical protein